MLIRSSKNKKHGIQILSLAAVFFVASSIPFCPVNAADSSDVTFNVDIQSSMSVDIDAPSSWASGNVGDFLRNKISVQVASNSDGYIASMTTQNPSTNLSNVAKSEYTIPTLTGDTTVATFPSNRWGYSLTDTTEGSTASVYKALVGSDSASPIQIVSSQTAGVSSKDVFFGTKANVSQAHGTYAGAVVITVVASIVNNDPESSEPSNSSSNSSSNSPSYNTSSVASNMAVPLSGSAGASGSSTSSMSSTDSYAAPQGVIEEVETISSFNGGNSVATGLAAATAVAAGTGAIFFVLAKRKKDDDEDEEEE